MKRILILSILALSLLLASCHNSTIGIIGGADGPTSTILGENSYLHESKNGKIYSFIGGEENNATTKNLRIHVGDGYSVKVSSKDYRYEKEYDDGALEEKWEYTKKDDVEIKVTTYKNSDENIFEDLIGYSICGQERDGDTLWFNIHQSGDTVYIVSWEFPKNTREDLQKELSSIAGTFTFTE